MTWQANLFNNLLTVGILLTLGIIVYCKVTGKTLADLAREIKEIAAERGGNEEYY